MTSTAASPLANAWRLPRDFVLITLALEVALALFEFTGSSESEQMRESFAHAQVWIPWMTDFAMTWLLVTALAWSHARQALEVRGAANVARLPSPRVRYAGAYLVMLALFHLALGPLLYELEPMLLSGGWLQRVFGSFAVAASAIVYQAAKLAVLVLSVWFAAWVALRAPAMAGSGDGDATVEVQAGESPRRAVAMLVAAVFVSLQVRWAMRASSGSLGAAPTESLAFLLLWVAPPLVVFALAFWGGWLGTAPGLVRVRPFRALAVSVLASVLVPAGCTVIAVAWLLLMLPSTRGMSGLGSLIALVGVLVVLYLALTVLLTRAITRRLYRPYL
ncbi:hypothetical protein CY658_17510 [Variovorax sp. RO1]|uniref:hypothetical protein n=1 Tax=Variovorax sp. RO1 TaxID=2066034 RepID=UPI000C7184EC|nr:hypothetical protein [Variovorax sp. RO1]PLC03843.1 hypothetical protein CY658_17510 [Variovorax sp. RO1]